MLNRKRLARAFGWTSFVWLTVIIIITLIAWGFQTWGPPFAAILFLLGFFFFTVGAAYDIIGEDSKSGYK